MKQDFRLGIVGSPFSFPIHSLVGMSGGWTRTSFLFTWSSSTDRHRSSLDQKTPDVQNYPLEGNVSNLQRCLSNQ